MGKMTRDLTEMSINRAELNAGNIKRFVAEHLSTPKR